MTLEILVDGFSRQLRQVELYQEKYWCKRFEHVASPFDIYPARTWMRTPSSDDPVPAAPRFPAVVYPPADTLFPVISNFRRLARWSPSATAPPRWYGASSFLRFACCFARPVPAAGGISQVSVRVGVQ